MEDLACSQGLVSILLEVLWHRHDVWTIDSDFVIVVIALDGVRPPPSQERRPTGATERNLSQNWMDMSKICSRIKPEYMLLSEPDSLLQDCQDWELSFQES